MPILLTREGMRAIFPRAPQPVIDAFVEKQAELDKSGATETRPRLAMAFAHVEHECGGFTIPHLTENINYTHQRMYQVWPNRFRSADHVREKYGTGPGWQKRAFDDIYGNRMGNRPGTRDGSTYIGRGGPQITGANGYEEVGKRAGLPLKENPEMAGLPEHQPAILAGFWSWKKMNRFADVGDFRGSTKAWNGGFNGLADRQHNLAANMPAIMKLPGGPSTPKPPKDVLDEATKNERKARTAGVSGAAAGTGVEVGQAGTKAPEPLVSPLVTYTLIGAGVAIVLIAAFLIARKRAAVVKNWF